MIDTVIFELAGRPVLLIDLVSSILGLTCVFLAGRNSKYNFWVGYLYTAALFFLLQEFGQVDRAVAVLQRVDQLLRVLADAADVVADAMVTVRVDVTDVIEKFKN